jgi:hypothetical protein
MIEIQIKCINKKIKKEKRKKEEEEEVVTFH